MSTSRFIAAAPLQRALAAAGLCGVTVLALAEPGATRMYASPWSLLWAFVHLVPFGLLALRLLSRDAPAALPAKSWTWWGAIVGAGLCMCALASPYRGPSMLAAATPLAAIATALLLHDWLAEEPAVNRARLVETAGWLLGAVVVTSLGLWLRDVAQDQQGRDLVTLAQRRNAHPLGHSNYTAGVALLALPLHAALAWRYAGGRRALWLLLAVVSLGVLITSGSRGGMAGLVVLLIVALAHARLRWTTLLIGGAGVLVLAMAVIVINPRTRTLLIRRAHTGFDLSASTSQRTAMITAAWRMGADRPLTGWGPGATPLAYPRYRGGLDGGAENVLQLHSTPAHLWAECGVVGVLGFVGAVALTLAAVRRHRGDPGFAGASIAAAGYLAFSLFDFQLDVPLFAMIAAGLLALLVSGVPSPIRAARLRVLGAAVAALGLIVLFAQRDRAPALNVRALTLASDRTQTPAAVDLLQQSLQLNPDQEIAHFNLGWLLVTAEPAQAAEHFRAAARLVPDKGGVYFGLALAELNRSTRDEGAVVHALALECLNDPLFLTSPWWRQDAIAPFRERTFQELRRLCDVSERALVGQKDTRAREARWVAALADWIEGVDAAGQMLALAHTSERVHYFVARPARPEFDHAGIQTYRRERTGYPVLMRNLDLPVPTDLFDVQENALAAGELRFLFPTKGWLPGRLLLQLLASTPGQTPLS